jgi:4-hydroxy-tetrahydrodipicolinate reductase
MQMERIRALVAGAGGRMGGRIVAALEGQQGIVLAGACEQAGHQAVGCDAGVVAGIGATDVVVRERLESVIGLGDVVIDFTSPAASLRHVELAVQHGTAVVLGTTGLSDEELATLEKAARKIPIVFAPNMSVGVNLLFKVLGDVAAVLGDAYDVEIVEAHHRYKKDAPSGTAKKMAQVVAAALRRDLEQVAVPGRSGMVGERKTEEIGIFAVRGGDIVGDHTVMFAGLGERIEITHRAHSRDTFARGAVRAAKWVVGRVPGLYDMMDVLGLK